MRNALLKQRRAASSWRLMAIAGLLALIVVGVFGMAAHIYYGLHDGTSSLPGPLSTLEADAPTGVVVTTQSSAALRSPPLEVAAPTLNCSSTSTTALGCHSPRKLGSWSTLYLRAGEALKTQPSSASDPNRELYGNQRAVIPLLLTSTKYHGTSLLATTIQGWILKFLIPQGNIDLIIFYDVAKVNLQELISVLKISKRSSSADGGQHQRIPQSLFVDVSLSDADAALLGDGYFTTSYHPTYSFRLHPVQIPFPEYLASNMTLLDDPSWMRCGCPPVCPLKRATVDYVQGTRWYTYDLFLQPVVHPYSFWIKLDVDIWMMREVPFNMVRTLIDTGAIFAHTGYIYNGHGCSNELHKAIVDYCAREGDGGIVPVAKDQSWWKQDDNVYYSNFVISSMAFHLSSDHMRLAKALTEYRTGFFKYRWTDQSLFHKVFGVFYGPDEANFLLDWSQLRCSKKRFRKGAVFYHSKGKKKSSVLRMCTDI